MSRFSDLEIKTIRGARNAFPHMPQRVLARKLFQETGSLGFHVRQRSKQAIYSALRRHDAKLAAVVTQGVQAATAGV